MGKGLSELQKKILRIAHRKSGESLSVWVSNREVLTEVYGFRPLRSLEEAKNGALIFDRKAIGISRYTSASVSVVKCFHRLSLRGLVYRAPGQGVTLTSAGIKLARRLNRSERNES